MERYRQMGLDEVKGPQPKGAGRLGTLDPHLVEGLKTSENWREIWPIRRQNAVHHIIDTTASLDPHRACECVNNKAAIIWNIFEVFIVIISALTI